MMPEYHCPWCKQTAQSPGSMRNHLRKAHPDRVMGKSAVFVKCEIDMSGAIP